MSLKLYSLHRPEPPLEFDVSSVEMGFNRADRLLQRELATQKHVCVPMSQVPPLFFLVLRVARSPFDASEW